MFHVDWEQVAVDSVLQEIRAVAGSGSDPSNSAIRPLVTSILSHAGGLPVAKTDWTDAQKRSVCKKLLLEAVGAVLRRKRNHRQVMPGCDLGPGAAGLDRVLKPRHRVPVNLAQEDALLPLPVLGPTTAARTVALRRSDGPFDSPMEIAARVAGVSESGATRLAMFLDCSTTARSEPAYVGDFATDLGTLINLQDGGSAADRLLAALEEVAVFCASQPHPATRGHVRRADLPSGNQAKLPARVTADPAEVLEDGAYYHRLKALLNGANTRIDVAMFFIAFPGESHPSKALLQRLAARHDAGVAVRVIVDKDGDDDPYGSRVINAPAIEFLKNRGVPVKTDTTTNLLHSKFVVIDNDLSVIGSHNWTVGSYFRYHDTSLAIGGPAFTASLSARFQTLWNEGEAA